MTDNEVGFLVALAFSLGHVCAWISVWVHVRWRR